MGRALSAFSPSKKSLAAVLCAGVYLLAQGLNGETAPQPQPAQAGAASAAPPAAHGPAVRHAPPYRSSNRNGDRSRAEPARLRIPAIGVDAPVMKLALDAAGSLDVPPADKANVAGWYAKGPAPGEAGTAVVAGHVDTPSGRAVFFSLGALRKGSTVEVARRDRHTAVFKVDAVEIHPRKGFPSRKVYGSSAVPQLRIITCGGGYSRTAGYLGNVVVYATLVSTR
ncbi:class F sortase [Streptomyces sp. NPDC007861]|uniref:class F sortase n=1 Tax=Streptomyces sp. NPDC007861 TaxID=3154893 RepID=UPI0033D83D20